MEETKIFWWMFGIVGFIIFISMLGGGGNNSNYKSGSSKVCTNIFGCNYEEGASLTSSYDELIKLQNSLQK